MSAIWYYVDLSQQQVGPVTADEVRAALRRGATSESSMAWRDGLAGWQPISELAAELGLSPKPPAPPPSAPGDSNPYQAPVATTSPSFQPGDAEIVYAGFWRRFAAHVLDHIVLWIPLGIVMIISGGLGGVTGSNSATEQTMEAIFYLGYLVLAPLYFAGMESSSLQATLGKLALRIKVTDDQGQRIGFGRALGRWFAATLSYATFYIGFIIAGFTDRKRALHDMVASTLVVDKWAWSDFPERQQRGMSGCLIAFLVFFVGGLFIVPILAAISISQYQDYVIRAQVQEAVVMSDGVKTAFGEYVNQNGVLPRSNADAGLDAANDLNGEYVSYVDMGKTPGRIEAGFSSGAPQHANTVLHGKHLYFDAQVGEGSIQWTCHSDDLKQKWCPSSCACSG